jgi:hypothetical protein
MIHTYINPDGQTVTWETPDLPRSPLDPTGALATLLAVLELSTVQDAANAVGLTPEDLVAEAEAWAMARTEDN